MKYVVISRVAPGVENARKALDAFLKVGVAPGTQQVYAATDSKTIISVIEIDEGDTDGMVTGYTYAPFFEETKVFAVMPVDETWVQAVQAAAANWD